MHQAWRGSDTVALLAIAGVLVVGWGGAVALVFWILKLVVEDVASPAERTLGQVAFFTAAVLLPGTPLVAAWLAARHGWTVAAWCLTGLAVVVSVVVVAWLVVALTTPGT